MGAEHEPTTSGPPATDSVAALLTKLGDPPEDVWRNWQDDAADHGVELPDDWRQVDWSQWRVDPSGRIRPTLDSDSMPPEPPVAGFSPPAADGPRHRSSEPGGNRPAARKFPAEWWWIGGAVALVGVVGLVAFFNRQPSPASTTAGTPEHAPAEASRSTTGNGAETTGRDVEARTIFDPSGRQSPATRLGSAIRPSASGSNASTNADEVPTDFSLDAFLPPSITAAGGPDGPTGGAIAAPAASADEAGPGALVASGMEQDSDALPGGEPSVQRDPAGASPLIAGTTDPADVMADADDPIPGDDQSVAKPTRGFVPPSTEHAAVRLPAIPESGAEASAELPDGSSPSESVTLPISLSDSDELRFEYPGRSPFQLDRQIQGDDSQWNLTESSSGKVLAKVFPIEPSESSPDSSAKLGFQWQSGASGSSAAGALLHGRLVTPSASVTFRPMLTGDPLRLDMSHRDTTVKWDLEGGIKASATRLEVALDLPQDVAFGWIEAIEPASASRTRGVAVVHLEDDENVALLVRLDLRTARWLSVRARYAARLDREMPWQWTDQPTITQSLEWALGQSARIRLRQEQVQRLAGQPETAHPTVSNDLLRRQEQALEQAVVRLQTLTERLATLDQLITMVSAEATVGIRVSVSWPDRDQMIFSSLPDERR